MGLSFVISQLDGTSLYVDSGGSSAPKETVSANRQVIEEKVQSLCLPYLRIAALLRHHLFNEEIPEVRSVRALVIKKNVISSHSAN